MAIFGFKKRKDEKLEQAAEATKAVAKKEGGRGAKQAKNVKAAVDSKVAAPKNISVPKLQIGSESNAASVIIRPRVTEKSGILSQNGVYTFEVAKNANKQMISRAISALYKVTPVKVAVLNTPIKNVFVKGRKGTVAGIRKAVVTVKKGDKIDFV
jgi:large subunit ribosomal protein L23